MAVKEINNKTELRFEEFDDTTTLNVIYIGSVDKNGQWQIAKFDTSAKTMRYARGESGYSNNWTNRTSLTYTYFDQA